MSLVSISICTPPTLMARTPRTPLKTAKKAKKATRPSARKSTKKTARKTPKKTARKTPARKTPTSGKKVPVAGLFVEYNLSANVDRQQYPHKLKVFGWKNGGAGQGLGSLDADFYGPASGKAAARAELQAWYAAKKRAGVVTEFKITNFGNYKPMVCVRAGCKSNSS